MDDKPIDGAFGEPPEEPSGRALIGPDDAAPPAPTEEGVVLFDPRPKEPLPIEEQPPPEPPARSWLWPSIGMVTVVAVGIVSYLLLVGVPGRIPIDPDAELPRRVPSMIGGVSARDALTPFPSADLRAPVNSSASIAVRVTGPGGIALADTLVAFSLEVGEGLLGATEARTDEDGMARVSLSLPSRPGRTVVSAELVGSSIDAQQIAITAEPGTPSRMLPLAGDGQDAGVGDLLPTRLSVRVADDQDNPVPGVTVNFRVRSGSGMTAPSQTRTDSLGEASALWRLGMVDGSQRLVATSPDFAGEVVFSAIARPRVQPASNEDRSAGVVVGPVTVRASTFGIGASHVCELVLTGARCRGATDRGQVSADVATGLVALASGVSHVCALTPDGTAYCWGANESGQLGDGLTTDRASPVSVRTELKFSALTAGAAHTCGLAGGGIPACWGLNLSGQLGDGSRNDQRGPRTVGGGLAFQSLAAGWNHTCGVTASGNAFCWGANSQGQLGDGSRLDRLVPTLARGAVQSLVAGSSHTCAISEGRVWCWGGNAFGQLGDGTTQDQSRPIETVGLPAPPVAMAAGAVHTCALMPDGGAYCWGQNLQGQLGDGSTENSPRPVPVSGGHAFAEIHAGGAVTCGQTAQGEQYCWGLNGSGQLGDGTRLSRSSPVRVGR